MLAKKRSRFVAGAALAAAIGVAATPAAYAESVLRLRFNGDFQQLDPVWTTNYTVRNAAYMVWDTLFATDAEFKVQPQMAVCCRSFGNFNFGEFISEAGGFNWGSKFFSGAGGVVNPEKIIVDDPAYVMVTGANWSNSNPGNIAVWLGYEMTEEKAQEQLKGLMARTGFPELTAVKNNNVMAVYHQFYQSPYHFVAVQALAKWLHPDKFADLDPQATFKELHERFLPIDVSGVFWTSLK